MTYDPAEHTVDEVNAHLETLAPAEATQVLEAEAAGRNRKGITGEDKPQTPKDGTDGYTRVLVDGYPAAPEAEPQE